MAKILGNDVVLSTELQEAENKIRSSLQAISEYAESTNTNLLMAQSIIDKIQRRAYIMFGVSFVLNLVVLALIITK